MMKRMKYDLFFLLFWITYLISLALSCQICENDPDLFDASAELAIPGQFQGLVSNCGSLQNLLPVILSIANIECGSIQGIAGPLCGCPVKHDDEEESCRLCGNANTSIPESFISKSITVYSNETNVLSSDFLLLMENGIDPSCQLLDGYAQSISSKNKTCDDLMEMFGSHCGCNEDSNATSIINTTTTTTIISTPQTAMEAPKMCEVCNTAKDKENFKPNEVLGITKEALQFPKALTCEEALPVARNIPDDSEACRSFNLFSYLCGCNDGIRLNLGADTKAKQAVLAWLPRFTGLLSFIGSSLIIWDVTKARGKKLQKSMRHQLVAGMSVFDMVTSVAMMFSTSPIPMTQFGSPTGVYGAMGNELTCTAQGFFVQLGYTGAFYNMLLSVYYLCVIRFNVSETRLLRNKFWFHIPVLLVGIGLAFGGIPFYDNVYAYCHIPPNVESVINGVTTYLTKVKNDIPIIVFSTIPITIVTTVGTLNMLIIYLHVRKQDKAANKWKISKYTEGSSSISNNQQSKSAETEEKTRHSSIFEKVKCRFLSYKTERGANSKTQNKMSDSVFWQAVFYLGSFLLCWPIFYTVNFSETLQRGGTKYYWVWVLLVGLVPLQGFFNAMVYFRNRITRYLKNQTAKWKEKIMSKKEDASSITRTTANTSNINTSSTPMVSQLDSIMEN